MNEQRLTLKSAAVAVLIILAGLPLRFELAQRLYLDFDEAMYFQAANEPTLADSWEACRMHTHPPLAFLMYHLWLPLGNSELMLRLPSILCGAVASWIAYLWLSRLTDRRAALVGVFLLTFSMPALHVSAQMRCYSFLVLFLFGALWFDERFRESGRVRYLLGHTSCLVLALLTHYGTAWAVGVLGTIGLVRAVARGLNAPATRAWVVSQFVLAGTCVWLYLTHVRGFVGSDVHDELWASLTHGNSFGDSVTGRLKFMLIGGLRFFGAMSGPIWLPMLCAAGVGAVLFVRSGSRSSLSGGISSDVSSVQPWYSKAESTLLVIGPFVFALLLQATKMYPLGATRHSLWLMPFVALAISAAARPLLNKPRAVWRVGLATACLAWAWAYPYRTVTQHKTELTPELMRQTVTQLKANVRRDELILTDEAARNVLAYYLGRDSVDRGREIAHGFREYRIDGFRLVTIPKFHTHWYSLRKDWTSFADCLGEQTTQPMWMVYMGFEVPGNDLKSLGQRLPPAKVLVRHTLADNHLLRVQFREPSPEPVASTSETESASAVRVAEPAAAAGDRS